MTLDEQLAWLPKLERIREVLDSVFGAGTEVTPLWDGEETWRECSKRISERRNATALRGYKAGRHAGSGLLSPGAKPVSHRRPDSGVNRPIDQPGLFGDLEP